MSKHNRRRRAKRQRKIALMTAVAVLVLAFSGLVVWLLSARAPGLIQQSYPMEYVDVIRQYAAENGLEPAYVAAVILAESSCDPEAVSPADARGLMQLLPSTAEWIAGKFDDGYSEERLFEPELNVRYGCWYLGYLSRRYGGDKRLASAAYHAGQGNVDKWLQNPEYSPDGASLSKIPYESTDTYVQRVLRFYEKYSELYAKI